MPTFGISVPLMTATGLDPMRIARNGVMPSATHINQYLTQFTAVANRRMKQHFSKSIAYSRATSTTSPLVTWRFQSHTSPNCPGLRARMVFAPNKEGPTTFSTLDPTLYWTTTKVGGGSKQHPTLNPMRQDVTGTVAPDDYWTLEQDWTDLDGSGAIGNTTFRAECTIDDAAALIACSIYEMPRTQLSLASMKAVNAQGLPAVKQGGLILDVNAASWMARQDTMWDRQAPPIFHWSVDAGVALTGSGTTPTNPLDSSTAWASTTAGFNYRNKDRGSRYSNNIPVVFWCYGTRTGGGGGGTGTVSFVDSTGTIGTITLNGASGTPGWFTNTGNLDASLTTSKIDIQVNGSVGGVSWDIYAAGIYEYNT